MRTVVFVCLAVGLLGRPCLAQDSSGLSVSAHASAGTFDEHRLTIAFDRGDVKGRDRIIEALRELNFAAEPNDEIFVVFATLPKGNFHPERVGKHAARTFWSVLKKHGVTGRVQVVSGMSDRAEQKAETQALVAATRAARAKAKAIAEASGGKLGKLISIAHSADSSAASRIIELEATGPRLFSDGGVGAQVTLEYALDGK